MPEGAAIIYAGGGTGGHLLPGLAVAQRVAHVRPDLRQVFLTGERPTERQIVARFGFEHLQMRAPKGPRRLWDWPAFLARFGLARLRCRQLLHSIHPLAVVGLGGYGSVPMVMSASGRCPIVLLEQNTIPGRATIFLSRRADVVVTSWAESREYLRPGTDVRHLGNPVRAGIADVAREDALDELGLSADRMTVLVWGGSQGSHAINEAVVEGLGHLGDMGGRVQFVHQTGQADESGVKAAYKKAGMRAHVAGFMHAPTAYAAADLFVGRSGATTLAEVCVVGLPMILVPYQHSAAGHQLANARAVEGAGAALVVEQSGLTGRGLAEMVCGLLEDGERRSTMARAAKSLARPQAANEVAELLLAQIESRDGA